MPLGENPEEHLILFLKYNVLRMMENIIREYVPKDNNCMKVINLLWASVTFKLFRSS